MTLDDTDAFGALLRRLGAACSVHVTDDHTEAYWRALEPFALAHVEAALDQLVTHWSGYGMPQPARWREIAEHRTDAAVRAVLPAAREEPWRVECPDCEDTGWRYRDRAGRDVEFVAAQALGVAGRCAIVCECRSRNRTYQRHHPLGVRHQPARSARRGGWTQAGDAA